MVSPKAALIDFVLITKVLHPALLPQPSLLVFMMAFQVSYIPA